MDNHADDVAPLTDYCSLLALAHGARIYKFSRPHMTPDNVIQIEGMFTLGADASFPGLLLWVRDMFCKRKAPNKPSGFNAFEE